MKKICRVQDCERAAICKGFCGLHYQQHRKGIRLKMWATRPIAVAKPWSYENPEGERQLMEQYAN